MEKKDFIKVAGLILVIRAGIFITQVIANNIKERQRLEREQKRFEAEHGDMMRLVREVERIKAMN